MNEGCQQEFGHPSLVFTNVKNTLYYQLVLQGLSR